MHEADAFLVSSWGTPEARLGLDLDLLPCVANAERTEGRLEVSKSKSESRLEGRGPRADHRGQIGPRPHRPSQPAVE